MGFDDLKYEIEEEARSGTRIKVIGVGGGGCNAVARMVAEGLDGVEFYAMNTDLQALSACPVPNKLQLGAKMTSGLGAGSNPEIGRQAALENTDAIVGIAAGRRHGVRHRRAGRRHRNRRGSGDRVAGQGTGCPDHRGGHQALRLRRPAAHAAGRGWPAQAGLHRGHRHRHPQRPSALAGAARHQLLRGVQGGRRPAAPGGAGHQRHHHHHRR